jgi:hypothetical protein
MKSLSIPAEPNTAIPSYDSNRPPNHQTGWARNANHSLYYGNSPSVGDKKMQLRKKFSKQTALDQIKFGLTPS